MWIQINYVEIVAHVVWMGLKNHASQPTCKMQIWIHVWKPTYIALRAGTKLCGCGERIMCHNHHTRCKSGSMRGNRNPLREDRDPCCADVASKSCHNRHIRCESGPMRGNRNPFHGDRDPCCVETGKCSSLSNGGGPPSNHDENSSPNNEDEPIVKPR